MADVLEFDGPPISHVFGVRYEVVSLNGVLEEGGLKPFAETMGEAQKRFDVALAVYTKGAAQIAWRRHPEAEEIPKKGFTITARLAVWRAGDSAADPFGVTGGEIVEALARRWFSRESFPPLAPEVWDRQPEEIREQFREHARRLWARPGYARFMVSHARHVAMTLDWELRQKLEDAI